MSNVSFNSVKKSYGSIEVIKDLNVEIQDGEFAVLVGPSGCGKSTLLRMVAGLEKITAGTISIGGKVINDLAPKDRDIAMVFQNYALYPQMTVEQNMSFSLQLAKVSKAEIKEKIASAAEILSLEDLLDRKPATLSGGQRQRVAMGRAIVRDPKVFLFDEPLSNLDAKLRVQMRSEIGALHNRLGTTIIYVTHDQVEAMTMADKIIVMKKGNIEQVGSPLDLYDNPVNIFVAGFLGSPSMNFLDVIYDGQKLLLENKTLIDISDSKDLKKGDKVTIGVRPEDVTIVDEGDIKATIKLVEHTGASTFLLMSFDGHKFTAVLKGRVFPKIGEVVSMSFENDKIHLFNSETGMTL